MARANVRGHVHLPVFESLEARVAFPPVDAPLFGGKRFAYEAPIDLPGIIGPVCRNALSGNLFAARAFANAARFCAFENDRKLDLLIHCYRLSHALEPSLK